MEGFFVLAIVATPFVFTGWLINRIFVHRAHMGEIELTRRYAALPAPSAVSPDVEQRLRNLEAIVTSSDYELEQRLRDSRAA
jgi:hypothetical protein